MARHYIYTNEMKVIFVLLNTTKAFLNTYLRDSGKFTFRNFHKKDYFGLNEFEYDREQYLKHFCNQNYTPKINDLGIKHLQGQEWEKLCLIPHYFENALEI